MTEDHRQPTTQTTKEYAVTDRTPAQEAITRADTSLGIEFGSTRFKAVLIGPLLDQSAATLLTTH